MLVSIKHSTVLANVITIHIKILNNLCKDLTLYGLLRWDIRFLSFWIYICGLANNKLKKFIYFHVGYAYCVTVVQTAEHGNNTKVTGLIPKECKSWYNVIQMLLIKVFANLGPKIMTKIQKCSQQSSWKYKRCRFSDKETIHVESQKRSDSGHNWDLYRCVKPQNQLYINFPLRVQKMIGAASISQAKWDKSSVHRFACKNWTEHVVFSTTCSVLFILCILHTQMEFSINFDIIWYMLPPQHVWTTADWVLTVECLNAYISDGAYPSGYRCTFKGNKSDL